MIYEARGVSYVYGCFLFISCQDPNIDVSFYQSSYRLWHLHINTFKMTLIHLSLFFFYMNYNKYEHYISIVKTLYYSSLHLYEIRLLCLVIHNYTSVLNFKLTFLCSKIQLDENILNVIDSYFNDV